MKKSGKRAAVVVITALALALIPLPAALSEPAAATATEMISPPSIESGVGKKSQESGLAVMRALSHPVNLKDLLSTVASVDENVVGYRYENDEIVGEFYPTEDYALAQFVADFELKYSTEPKFAALLVAATQEKEKSSGPGVAEIVEADGAAFEPQEADLSSSFEAPTKNLQPDVSGVTGGQETQRRDDDLSTDWYPEDVSVDIETLANGHTQISQLLDWKYVAPTDVLPEHYGVEAAVDAYNYTYLSAYAQRPFACPALYSQYFFADSHQMNWQVVSQGSTLALAPYKDTDALDECGRQTFTLGVRYPRDIQSDIGGRYKIRFNIDAPSPQVPAFPSPHNRIQANLQLVFDQACYFGPPYPALAECMGSVTDPPDGVSPGRPVLNAERGAFAPDRCWISADYGATPAIPVQSCGQPTSLAGIDATILEVSTLGNNGRDFAIAHQLLVPQPTGSSLPLLYSSRFPYLADPNRPTTTSITNPEILTGDTALDSNRHTRYFTGVRDMRAWIGTTEIAVGHSEDWHLDIPAAGDQITLSNINGTAIFGDGLTDTMKAFAHDGTISFRVGEGPINYIKMTDLEGAIPPGAGLNTYVNPILAGDYDTDWYTDSAEFLVSGKMQSVSADFLSDIPDIPIVSYASNRGYGQDYWRLTYTGTITDSYIEAADGVIYPTATACAIPYDCYGRNNQFKMTRNAYGEWGQPEWEYSDVESVYMDALLIDLGSVYSTYIAEDYLVGSVLHLEVSNTYDFEFQLLPPIFDSRPGD